jgi:lipopolysaccharide biosynthesis glycosyltransferase
VQELGSPLNFARYFIGELFPDLDRRLCYIDDDVIVRGA